MIFKESPYRCPFPNWLAALLGTFVFWAYFLAMIVLGLTWLDMDVNREILQKHSNFVNYCHSIFLGIGFSILYFFVSQLWISSSLVREILFFLFLFGSVSAAFHDDYYYGLGWLILLIILMLPYYYALFLTTCFLIKEYPKHRSLLGKEGLVIETFQFGVTIEIDSEKFDAAPYSNGTLLRGGFNIGTPVIVQKVTFASIEVERKSEDTETIEKEDKPCY
ncbi:MAG: hypothetical protein LBU65_17390 [Planctomycetaceae bacterium]|jgi:hypothetical protein|nr:hypothetical protein [Planctomycetaceae bacterium]